MRMNDSHVYPFILASIENRELRWRHKTFILRRYDRNPYNLDWNQVMTHQAIAKRKDIFLLTDTNWHTRTIQWIVGVLMVALYVWIGAGILSLLGNLPDILRNGWAYVAEHIIIDIVLILAVLELIRILQSYLAVGRVKVTFILDVAVVVLIGELIGLWYKEYTAMEVGLHIAAITVLTLLRIVSIRFSPDALD